MTDFYRHTVRSKALMLVSLFSLAACFSKRTVPLEEMQLTDNMIPPAARAIELDPIVQQCLIFGNALRHVQGHCLTVDRLVPYSPDISSYSETITCEWWDHDSITPEGRHTNLRLVDKKIFKFNLRMNGYDLRDSLATLTLDGETTEAKWTTHAGAYQRSRPSFRTFRPNSGKTWRNSRSGREYPCPDVYNADIYVKVLG